MSLTSSCCVFFRLSHHAEELFGDLIRVESEIATRANNLQARIDRLAVKVVQMDNTQEERKIVQVVTLA